MKISSAIRILRKDLPRKVASIEVDVINSFTELCMDELPVKNAVQIVEPINRLSAKVDLRVGSKCAHQEDAEWVTDKNEEIGAARDNPQSPHKWKSHGVPGTFGFEMVDGMPDPIEYDYFVWKGIESKFHPYGVCYHNITKELSTGLIEWLVMNDVTEVVVSGLAYDYCVRETLLELAETKLFKVVVIKECTKGLKPESYPALEKEFMDNGVEIIETVDQFENLK